jgi:hypothetical protein
LVWQQFHAHAQERMSAAAEAVHGKYYEVRAA